jgi:hypothetical protein
MIGRFVVDGHYKRFTIFRYDKMVRDSRGRVFRCPAYFIAMHMCDNNIQTKVHKVHGGKAGEAKTKVKKEVSSFWEMFGACLNFRRELARFERNGRHIGRKNCAQQRTIISQQKTNGGSRRK